MLKTCQRSLIVRLINSHVRCIVVEATNSTNVSALVSKLKLRRTKEPIKSSEIQEKTASEISNESSQGLGSMTKIRILKKNNTCDEVLLNLIKLNDTRNLSEKLVYFENLHFVPSRKTLLILASYFAKNGDIENIKHVQQICLDAYPKEFEWMMGYKHYEAEGMWKIGEVDKSIQIFQVLFNTHNQRRKKITDMTVFLIEHVFAKKLREHYQALEQFSKKCLNDNFFLPAVYLWSVSIMSTDYQAWNVCDNLFDVNPDLKNRVVVKFDCLIRIALANRSTELLQRLIEFVLKHNLNNYLNTFLGALLILQCENENIRAALETFHYADEMKVKLPAESVQCLYNVLIQHKHEIPMNLLRLKYLKTSKTSPLKINW